MVACKGGVGALLRLRPAHAGGGLHERAHQKDLPDCQEKSGSNDEKAEVQEVGIGVGYGTGANIGVSSSTTSGSSTGGAICNWA